MPCTREPDRECHYVEFGDEPCDLHRLVAENERLRYLAVPMCDVEGCGEDATLGFVMNPGDGLRYGISVCEEHFDNGM